MDIIRNLQAISDYHRLPLTLKSNGRGMIEVRIFGRRAVQLRAALQKLKKEKKIVGLTFEQAKDCVIVKNHNGKNNNDETNG